MQVPAALFIIDKFGSIRKTADALGIPTSTVQGWFERERIPVDRWPEVIEALSQIDVAFTVEDFLSTHYVEKSRKKAAA